MAATILENGPVCDGFDARVSIDGGPAQTFHFPAQPGPANLQAAVDAIAAEQAASAAAESWTITE